jgi:hypothetical protein
MIQLRVSEIGRELIGLCNQQKADLDSNGALRDWTQLQLEEYEHRRDRIRRLTEELLQLPKPLLKRVSPGSSV